MPPAHITTTSSWWLSSWWLNHLDPATCRPTHNVLVEWFPPAHTHLPNACWWLYWRAISTSWSSGGVAGDKTARSASAWAASSPRTGACQPSWLTASNWPARPFGACRRPHGATPACRWRPRSPSTKVLVSSALLCGSHAWAPTPAQLQKLELVQRQHLRHTLRRPLARVACCSRADWCRPGGRGAHSWQRPAE